VAKGKTGERGREAGLESQAARGGEGAEYSFLCRVGKRRDNLNFVKG